MTEDVVLVGRVTSGRGVAGKHLRAHAAQIRKLTGENILDGSMNILLDAPVQFVTKNALTFDGERRLIWPGSIGGIPIWLYRWRSAPLHLVEILASRHLRNALGLQDGDKVFIRVSRNDVENLTLLGRVGWAVFWAGRRGWYYPRWRYSRQAEFWSKLFGANQIGSFASLVHARYKRSAMLSRARGLLSARRSRANTYVFERTPLDGESDGKQRTHRQIQNLLNYTKTSGSSYAAQIYPAGYHTIELGGEVLQGQRDPAKRLASVPYDFENKRILDIGCNQGGMLFQLDERIRWGVGIDYDPRMINVANRINAEKRTGRLNFYVFDLEKEPLDIIQDFLPEPEVDVVFLLSVCMWLKNWRDVLAFASRVSNSMLFESNGTPAQQSEQQLELAKLYRKVSQLTDASEDDPGQRNRRLFFCESPVGP